MLKVKFKIWVEEGDQVVLGNGRVRLLQAIEEHGSISAAAKSMKMSYKKAWAQIDGMNAASETSLVEKSTGGKNGGGAVVTAYGKDMVAKFLDIKEECQKLIESKQTTDI